MIIVVIVLALLVLFAAIKGFNNYRFSKNTNKLKDDLIKAKEEISSLMEQQSTEAAMEKYKFYAASIEVFCSRYGIRGILQEEKKVPFVVEFKDWYFSAWEVYYASNKEVKKAGGATMSAMRA